MKDGYIVASNEVMLLGKPVGYLYREEPSNEDDSGWRVFSGEETREYADDPNNFSLYYASSVVKVAPELREFLQFDFPVAFERDRESGQFVVVDGDKEET